MKCKHCTEKEELLKIAEKIISRESRERLTRFQITELKKQFLEARNGSH